MGRMSDRQPSVIPFQLVPGDRLNIALGCAIYLALTGSSEVINNKFLRKNLQAYTSWNWVLIVSRILLRQEQWDPFLLSNSFGVCMAFRTAGARGLTEMMRQKMALRGVKLTKLQFAAMDHWVHTVPVVLMMFLVVRSGRRPLMTNGIVGIMAQMFFAYSQADRYIGTKGCRALCEALRHIGNDKMLIHSLNLAGNNIHSEGLVYLGNAIRSSQALRHVKEIVLDWNPLGEASPQCFESLLSSLSVAPDLSILSMQECQISPAGAEAIASTLLTHSRSLRHLNLSHNALGPTGGEVLASALNNSGCHTLTTVKLTGNSIPFAIQQGITQVTDRNERMTSRGHTCQRLVSRGTLVHSGMLPLPKVARLQQELEALERGVADKEKRIHAMNEQHAEQLNRQMTTTDKRLSEASIRYEKELGDMKDNMAGLQKELAASNERCAELMMETEQVRKEMRKAETDMQDHKHAREQLEREVADKHRELMERSAELAATRRRAGEEMSQLRTELGRERQALHDKEAAVENYQREMNALV
ncbi:conserved hypothetical protein [Perkinsus marinus ATCC 50983]|uniref:Uncharacterized protein n=1 Tax=Perkinsus marinus (strain ATCC 50983 / TXsc) TaxID=423536 RepID=C5LYT2_PERM5|nr:conserved hypothetical protein [Perkinsus marinus ATCC 50983]EEQ98106.1 conserved hypothetical protein [Perkinsus marinus ATCC 50983]|eukprot:XP_002765389.1 conserved hypothetical protein [Perkinsus marinus ATCC 50983]